MLPPKRVQTILVKPTAGERLAMDEMFQHAKARFEQYKEDNVAVRRSVEVLQLLQPLRIACSAGTVDMVAHRERMKGELSRDAVRSVVEKFREKGSMTTEKFELATEASINDILGECSICTQTPLTHLTSPLSIHSRNRLLTSLLVTVAFFRLGPHPGSAADSVPPQLLRRVV